MSKLAVYECRLSNGATTYITQPWDTVKMVTVYQTNFRNSLSDGVWYQDISGWWVNPVHIMLVKLDSDHPLSTIKELPGY